MGDSSPRPGALVIGRRSFFGRAIAAIVALLAGSRTVLQEGDRPEVDLIVRDLKKRSRRDAVRRAPKRYQVTAIHDGGRYSSQVVPEISPLLKAAGVEERSDGVRVTYEPIGREIFFRSENGYEEIRIFGNVRLEVEVGDWVWIEYDADGSAIVL